MEPYPTFTHNQTQKPPEMPNDKVEDRFPYLRVTKSASNTDTYRHLFIRHRCSFDIDDGKVSARVTESQKDSSLMRIEEDTTCG